MVEKYRGKYRIPSARLQSWDYGNNGIYFVTICTANRENYFGEIDKDNMLLNDVGKIANECWLDIPNHFSHVELDTHIIMPNHLHGIIIIDNIPRRDDLLGRLETQGRHNTPDERKWKPGTLGVIINQYKRAVSIQARKFNSGFAWQSRFHDHIVRDTESYQKINNYIRENPLFWKDDRYNNE